MRLARGCKAGMLLLGKFQSGEITRNEKPKAVHQSDPEFQKYSLTRFRTLYNRIKKDISTAGKSSPNDENFLNRKCTAPLSSPTSKKRRIDDDNEGSEDEEDGVINLDEASELAVNGAYHPLTLVSEWVEPISMTRRVSVCIALPSHGKGWIYLRVLEGGWFLEVSVAWPRPLSSMDVMLRKWKTLPREDPEFMSDYHPELMGFEQALKGLRERRCDTVHSITKIALPFPVETHIVGQFPLAWRDDTMRAVYIRLRALVEQYAVQTNTPDFEVV